MNTFEELAQKYNTEDLFTAILSMQYLGKDELKDTYLPAAELFASNLVRYCNTEQPLTMAGHRELAEMAKSIFHNTSIYSILNQALKLRTSNASDEKKEEFLQSMQMKIKNMVFRGDGYAHQLINVAEKLYKPFDKELIFKFGFSFSCTEAVIVYIIQTYDKRYKAIFSKTTIMDFIRYIGSRLFHKISYIQVAHRATGEYRIYKSELYSLFPKEEIDCMIKELSIVPGTIEYGNIDLGDFSPLYSKPFIDFGSYIYLPLPESTLLNLPKLFHYYFVMDGIFSKDIKGRYDTHRGEVIEDLTAVFLKRLIKQGTVYRSLKYPAKQKKYEADVTIVNGNISVFSECKAKILVTASLNGNITTLKDDVYKAIGKAYEQAIRTIKYVRSGGQFYLPEKDSRITLPVTRYNYILCVNIENFGNLPSEIKKYVAIDSNIPIIPIAINLYDLDIITAECVDFNEFIDYLEFRIANIDVMESFDELDSFSYFKKYGKNKIRLESNGILMIDNLTKDYNDKYYTIATTTILSKKISYHR